VELGRPRDRALLGRDPAYRAVRTQVLTYLLGPGSRQGRAKALAESTASKRPGPSGTGATEAAA
jgi:hypothetical protein